MPSDHWDTTFTVAAQPEVVYRHLADPRNYIGLSPLVVDVRDIRPGTDAQDRDRVAYLAVERFRFAGILHWDNKIKVVMTLTSPGQELVSEVNSPGNVQLAARVVLAPASEETGGGTFVTETVDVRFPAMLRRLVVGQARSVAAYRAEELTRRMRLAR